MSEGRTAIVRLRTPDLAGIDGEVIEIEGAVPLTRFVGDEQHVLANALAYARHVLNADRAARGTSFTEPDVEAISRTLSYVGRLVLAGTLTDLSTGTLFVVRLGVASYLVHETELEYQDAVGIEPGPELE